MQGNELSIIIPVYRDWSSLKLCLKAIESQTYSDRVTEVIVVNNDPDDGPPEDFRFPDFVKLVSESKPGSYAARNKGIEIASGQLLLFTDADCIPKRDWVENFLKFHEDNNGDRSRVMAGQVELFSNERETAKLNFFESYDYVFGINQELFCKHGVAATANLLVPREIVNQLNGFDDNLFSGGDADFCRRARMQGYQLAYCRDATVLHPLRCDYGTLATRIRRLVGGKLKRKKAKELLFVFAPPIARFKVLMEKRQVPFGVRIKALLVVLYVKLFEIFELIKLSLNPGSIERK